MTDRAGEDDAAPLDAAALEGALASGRLGRPLIYLPEVGSTNTHAVELARGGAPEGTLVIADEQAAGRGRVGRAWRSMPRCQLALSLVLRPRFPAHFLVMAAALAVAETCDAVLPLPAAIKWPNDVLGGGRKLCGILIETGSGPEGAFAVVGIGLNVNGSLAGDAELGARAATLAELAGRPLVREEVAAALIARLDALYARLEDSDAGRAAVRAAWRARLVTLGGRVEVRQGERVERGMAEDVDADGGLMLLRDDGSRLVVTWGDVN